MEKLGWEVISPIHKEIEKRLSHSQKLSKLLGREIALFTTYLEI